ncbi:hypothetical protein HY218_00975 [Candidatus Saccharibacteria bacterium]|nr:hypothetical protein [Candidatus Saccharibacteria bacterium]
MARLLSELLGADEPMFSLTIGQLERASGHQGLDVRLSAEIIGKVHHSLRALGLDPKDTNGPELYHALLDLVQKHDEFLAHRIGGDDPGDVADLLPRVVAVAQRIHTPRQVWVMKHSVAKRLLSRQPPRKIMKLLGYRSVDSLLKREPMGEIFGALRFAESPDWLERFVAQYSRLSPSDFETRPVEIIQLKSAKWRQIAHNFIRSQHHNITHSKEMGSIIVMPLPVERLPGITVVTLPLLLHYINELRLYSAYFKLQQVKTDFGKIIADTVIHDRGNHARLVSQPIHWRVIYHHFANHPASMRPELFEPHVQPEDLEWRQAEEILFHLEPALQFWHGLDYAGIVKDGQCISLNLIDVATNYINQMSFDQQVSHHLRGSLWNELFGRYMGHPALEAQVLRQLDNEMIQSDLVTRGLLV